MCVTFSRTLISNSKKIRGKAGQLFKASPERFLLSRLHSMSGILCLVQVCFILASKGVFNEEKNSPALLSKRADGVPLPVHTAHVD